jgi:hypothetical protein
MPFYCDLSDFPVSGGPGPVHSNAGSGGAGNLCRSPLGGPGIPRNVCAQYRQLVRSAPSGARLLTSSAHFSPNICT